MTKMALYGLKEKKGFVSLVWEMDDLAGPVRLGGYGGVCTVHGVGWPTGTNANANML